MRGADYVTVSWNHSAGTDKSMLTGHSDGAASTDVGHLKVSIHHNWFDGSRQRHPPGPLRRAGPRLQQLLRRQRVARGHVHHERRRPPPAATPTAARAAWCSGPTSSPARVRARPAARSPLGTGGVRPVPGPGRCRSRSRPSLMAIGDSAEPRGQVASILALIESSVAA
ncbi:hypothetical protein ACGFJ7_20780 [Actinoplanes sp. NPDC048988]|uniref:pectate lyase family protein n=1 Tax=Actinoplanes sp. NPDC048988 TaxID=3363901 RepID=UPI003715784B